MTAPLRGLRVVELETGLAGSIAGKLLADHGATVFKRSASESQSTDPPVWDRAKTVLRTDGELESEALRCDVLITGPTEVGESPPSIVTGEGTITCTITGYGRTGPLAGRPAEDSLVAARLGLVDNQPGWSEGPSFIAHPIPSFGAALLASQAICAALLFREITGRTIDVETSLAGGTIAMSSRVAGRAIPKGRTWFWKANGPLPFYSSYECSDGAWLQLGCIHDGFVQKAIEALGIEDPIIHERPGRPNAPADLDRVEKQYRLLAEAMATRSRHDWLAILEGADVPCAPVNSSADYLSDPQALHNAGGVPLGGGVAASIRIHVDSEDPPLGASDRTGGGTDVDSDAFGHGRAEAAAPLRGLRVLEIGNLIAGPMSSRLLADLGAEVIKLEPPGIGDITRQNGSPAFYPLNSGKRGIAVDLRSDAGREIGQTLAANADVLIDNMRPGVAERLGLGWDQLRKRRPQLIYCHVSAFGSTGPYAHRPGLDPLAGALSGLQLEQGGGANRPVYLQGALVDHTAAMLAAYGVLVALFARSRTGRGGRIETSLLDAAALLNAPAYASSGPRSGERSQFGPNALNRLYRTADGWIALAVRTDAAAQQLRALLDEDVEALEWSGEKVSVGDDRVLAAGLETLFARRTADWWLDELANRGVPAERVASGEDHAVLFEPHLVETGMVIDQAYRELGTLRITHGWWQLGGAATAAPPSPAPELGEHTVEILEELGYSIGDIEEWMSAGVVAGGLVE